MPTSSNKVGGNSLKKMKRNLPAFLCQKNQKNPCDLGYFYELLINSYQLLPNCMYWQSVKPVTFIFKNIVLRNNLFKQYHALNIVLWLLRSCTKIWNTFYKINYDDHFSGIYLNHNRCPKFPGIYQNCRLPFKAVL